MIHRRLRIGHLYLVRAVAQATDDDLLNSLVVVRAQLPDTHLPPGFCSVTAIGTQGRYKGRTVLIQGRLSLHNAKPQTTCNCRAYDWPHRLGSGHCWGLQQGPFCGDCGRPAQIHQHSAAAGGHSTSACCNAPLYHDPVLEDPL